MNAQEKVAVSQLSDALIQVIEVLAYHRAGGSVLVRNIETPQAIAKAIAALERVGVTSAAVFAAVERAERRAVKL